MEGVWITGTLRMTFTDGLSSPTASPKDMILESALIKAIGGTVGTIPFEVAAPLEHTFTNFARSTCLRHVRVDDSCNGGWKGCWDEGCW